MLHMNSHTKGGGCGHKKGKRKSRISKGSVDNIYSYSFISASSTTVDSTNNGSKYSGKKILHKVQEAKLELDTSFLCVKNAIIDIAFALHLHCTYNLHSIYLILGIISNLEMIQNMQRGCV